MRAARGRAFGLTRGLVLFILLCAAAQAGPRAEGAKDLRKAADALARLRPLAAAAGADPLAAWMAVVGFVLAAMLRNVRECERYDEEERDGDGEGGEWKVRVDTFVQLPDVAITLDRLPVPLV